MPWLLSSLHKQSQVEPDSRRGLYVTVEDFRVHTLLSLEHALNKGQVVHPRWSA